MVQNMSIAPGTKDEQAAHDAAMAAKGEEVLLSVTELSDDGTRVTYKAEPSTQNQEQQQQQPAHKAKAQKPEHVPDKFWDAEKGEVNFEAWAKSTRELEQRFHQQNQQKTNEQQQQQQDGNDVPKGETPAQSNAIQLAANEYAQTGDLSKETREKLVKSGIDEDTINTYLAGLKAQEKLMVMEAYQLVGGAENYEAMIQWAQENLSDAEIDAFDAALDDPAQRDSAIQGLYARFQLNGSYEGNPVQPNASAARAGSGAMFRSRFEMQEAMSDPRYKAGDRAFHEEVQIKMANALAAGIDLFS